MGQKLNVHSLSAQKPRRRRSARKSAGFSLVELMVVVGIIILLLGIGIVAGARFIAEGKKEQTKAMLDGLLGANTEFQAQRKQGSVNHEGKFPIDWAKNNGSKYSSSERFVYACSQIDAVAKQLDAAVTSSGSKSMQRIYVDKDNDKVQEIYDVWGTQIEYRSANFKGEGTGPVTNVANNKLPLSKFPFFVSAGPDKKFGPQPDGSNDDIMTIENPVYK